MKKILPLLIIISFYWTSAQSKLEEINFVKSIMHLDFELADKIAIKLDKGPSLPYFHFIRQLAYNSGQNPKEDKIIFDLLLKSKSIEKETLHNLTLGIYHLYNDDSNQESFKYLTESFIGSKQNKNFEQQKISLFFILELYSQEIVQSSDSYIHYLEEFKSKIKNDIEKFWYYFYNTKLISKREDNNKNRKQFKKAFLELTKHFLNKTYNNNLNSYYRYLDALNHQLNQDHEKSINSYMRVVELTSERPFLKYLKFSSLIQLSQLFSKKNNFNKSKLALENAKKQWNISDTIRSRLLQKKYAAIYYLEPLKKYDSAYFCLKESIKDEHKLDFRKNTLKISELNVQLQTAEKEKLNLILQTKVEKEQRQQRNQLIASISLLILGSSIAFLTYKNTKRKQHIAEQKREIEVQKTEKLLKNQELASIDAMIAGQEKERQRLANDLHDNLGSTLATVKLHFQHLKNNKDNSKIENIGDLYDKTDNLLEEAYQKVRTIAHEKNSGVMANQGLLLAIKKLAKKVSSSNELLVEVQDYGLDKRLDNALEISIFRMIQELITNIIKHANATEVHISLTNHDSLLNIIIEDNGKGFDAKVLPEKDGMGLATIEKRIEHLEGTFEIDSTIEKGTNIIINIPI